VVISAKGAVLTNGRFVRTLPVHGVSLEFVACNHPERTDYIGLACQRSGCRQILVSEVGHFWHLYPELSSSEGAIDESPDLTRRALFSTHAMMVLGTSAPG
jgi:hypothetical protein